MPHALYTCLLLYSTVACGRRDESRKRARPGRDRDERAREAA
eukprot:COSAG02_NODE_22385_length_754_cov_1.219847_1_plen_41_part_10